MRDTWAGWDAGPCAPQASDSLAGNISRLGCSTPTPSSLSSSWEKTPLSVIQSIRGHYGGLKGDTASMRRLGMDCQGHGGQGREGKGQDHRESHASLCSQVEGAVSRLSNGISTNPISTSPLRPHRQEAAQPQWPPLGEAGAATAAGRGGTGQGGH
jgi:hypothetical protein